MSVDNLFKRPGLPSGNALKRKLEVPDAEAVYKATKISNGSSPNGIHANVEDDDDLEAGPELPPDEDADGDRFFGGGVTQATASALDYIDEQDGDDLPEEKIDSAWLRRLAVSFEKKVKKNSEQRARYESDPQKFMASEADLDAEIQNWSLLSEHPELYVEVAESEACGLLVGLLAHENTDIAIRAIEILSELLDEDVEAEQEQWDALANALLDADLLDLLMSNLSRLEEDEESDRSGIYHSLSVMESLAGQQSIAERIGKEKVLMWLCNRVKVPEKVCSQNKQYAAEVLQVLLQSSNLLRKRFAVDVEGVDLLLQLLAACRKRDPPKDSTEEEYAENIFDALICVVDEADGKSKFIEAEGLELALIMAKEGSFSKIRALRLIDHACDGQDVAMEVCEKVVDAGGLKTLFSVFMKQKKSEVAMTEHVLGISAALLRHLPGESASRIRTLAKFVEKDYEKVGKLIDVRQDYVRRLAVVDKEIQKEQVALDVDDEDRSDEFFSRRMEGGLYGLQTIDTILAWLVAEDAAAKRYIVGKLGELDAVRATLSEAAGRPDGSADQMEMLKALIEYLV